jgi:hypothetical protein
MARDYREFIKEHIAEDNDFGNGLHQYCLDLLQSSDAEDRRDGESMLLNYFGPDALRTAQREASTTGEPAPNAAN